ncbi:MAG: ThiF family adenylyltransferase [Rhodothermales bacterium]
MPGPLTSDERERVLQDVAASGLLRSPLRPDGTGGILAGDLVGRVTVGGREARVGIMLEARFPLALPRLLLYPWDAFGHIPHVDPVDEESGVGLICYQDSEGIILDRRRPAALAIEALRRGLDLLADGASGRNRADFAEEWEAHWARAGGDSVRCVVDPPGRVTDLAVVTWRGGTAGEPVEVRYLAERASDLPGYDKSLSGEGLPTRRALYVPLAAGATPSPPPPLGPFWTAEEVCAFMGASLPGGRLSHVKKRARRMRRRTTQETELVVFSLPRPSGGATLFGVEFAGVQADHPLFGGRCSGVRPVQVLRRDCAYLVPRGGADDALSRKRALVVGCGAVGGHIAVQLARAGVLDLTLVDPDVLREENVYRHVLGKTYCGYKKVIGLNVHIERELPYTTVDAVGENVLDAVASGRVVLADYDLVVVALGSPTVELDLNERLWSEKHGPPTVFTWVEPYGIGGHALLVRPGERGCFECLYTPPAPSAAPLSNRAAFAGPPPPGRSYGKALSGCGSLFTPYGSADALQTALLAVRLGVRALTGVEGESPLLSWQGDPSAFEEAGFSVTARHRRSAAGLEEQRCAYVSSRCPICGVEP